METLLQDLRFALRRLQRSPAFVAVAVTTLGLGIGANAAVFSVVRGVVLRPLAFPGANRLLMVWERKRGGEAGNTSFATFRDWRARTRSFDAMAALAYWTPTVSAPGDAERLAGLRVSASFFDLLGVRPALGRSFLPEDDQPGRNGVAVLNYGLWQRRWGGDPSVVGKTIVLSGREHTVVGVLPEGFEAVFGTGPERPAEIWSPLGYAPEQPSACRTCRHLRVIGRLAANTSLTQATAEMNAISQALFAEHPKDYSGSGVVLQPTHEYFVGPVSPVLLVLLGCVGLVLLIACVNLANLQLARVSVTLGELSIRAALGASRARLLRQQLGETFWLAAAGGSLGVVIATWGTDALLALSPRPLPRVQAVRLDGGVLAFAAAASLLAALVAGIAPALRATGVLPQRFLAEISRGVDRGQQLQRVLVACEVALCLALLGSAGVLLRSLERLLNVDPGFQIDNVLTAEVTTSGPRYAEDRPTWDFFRGVAEQVRSLPGVVDAGVVSQLPLGGNFDTNGIVAADKPLANPADAPRADRYAVTPGYLPAMGIRMLRGRCLAESDRADAPPIVLVNEALARIYWANEDPIGRRIRFGETDSPWREVVGVVANVKHHALAGPATAQFYVPLDQGPYADSTMVVVARTAGDTDALAGTLRSAIARLDPTVPVLNLRTMADTLRLSLAERRFAARLFTVFAVAAALLMAFGVFGVVQHAVNQRTREIAIRMALGASLGDVWRWVLRQGLRPTLAGLAAGLFLFAWLARFLGGLVYGVAPTDAVTLIAVSGLTTLVATLACVLPALRATRADPMVLLRYE